MNYILNIKKYFFILFLITSECILFSIPKIPLPQLRVPSIHTHIHNIQTKMKTMGMYARNMASNGEKLITAPMITPLCLFGCIVPFACYIGYNSNIKYYNKYFLDLYLNFIQECEKQNNAFVECDIRLNNTIRHLYAKTALLHNAQINPQHTHKDTSAIENYMQILNTFLNNNHNNRNIISHLSQEAQAKLKSIHTHKGFLYFDHTTQYLNLHQKILTTFHDIITNYKEIKKCNIDSGIFDETELIQWYKQNKETLDLEYQKSIKEFEEQEKRIEQTITTAYNTMALEKEKFAIEVINRLEI